MDLFISKAQDEQLRKLQKKTGISRSEHMRRALDEYLARVADAKTKAKNL